MSTPYMNLDLPVVSSTVGPDWANKLNVAITSIDSHDHTSGKGTLVPTSGININADLAFNTTNNATLLRSVRFINQGSPLALGTDLGCIYESGGNFYYNNSSGVAVQITSGAGLNAASIGAIGGDYATSTASLFYTSASKVFTFWQSANTPAKIDTGDVILRSISTPTNGITFQCPNSLAASYTLKYPGALPGSTLPLTCDTSGNIAFSGTMSTINVTASATFAGALSFDSAITSNLLIAPSGTKLPFYQASAPTGWTRDAVVNDRFLRIVTAGSPGTTGGAFSIPNASTGISATHTHTHGSSGMSAQVGITSTNRITLITNGNTFTGNYRWANGGIGNDSTAEASVQSVQVTGSTDNPSTSTVSVTDPQHTHTHGSAQHAYADFLLASKN